MPVVVALPFTALFPATVRCEIVVVERVLVPVVCNSAAVTLVKVADAAFRLVSVAFPPVAEVNTMFEIVPVLAESMLAVRFVVVAFVACTFIPEKFVIVPFSLNWLVEVRLVAVVLSKLVLDENKLDT